MQEFPDRTRRLPPLRDSVDRRQDFREIYGAFPDSEARGQAGRCAQCGIPYCQIHCPLQNQIPDWLMLAEAGRLREAWEVSTRTNNFPEICGRICPQDRLCEGSCVIETSGHGAVTIGAIEKYLTEHAFSQGWVQAPMPTRDRSDRHVGIIGAGPAGLAAAELLRRMGYRVSVYDRYDRVGGLLIYGIPGFKLEKGVVQRREALLREAGIAFHLNTEIGRNEDFARFRARHDAVLVATGVYQPRALELSGSGVPGIIPALPFLIHANRQDLGDACGEEEAARFRVEGKRVVVIGGGDTAMDCVRTAVRGGAVSVRCLYRRDQVNMPGSQREVQNAVEEGVEFSWLTRPVAFHADPQSGALATMEIERMRLGLPGPEGRRVPEPVEGARPEAIPAEVAILALGFVPEALPELWRAPDLPVLADGRMAMVEDANARGGEEFPTMETDLPGVFAAGDIVRGASLVVWAIRDGRLAAHQIHRWLQAAHGERPRAPALAAAG